MYSIFSYLNLCSHDILREFPIGGTCSLNMSDVAGMAGRGAVGGAMTAKVVLCDSSHRGIVGKVH